MVNGEYTLIDKMIEEELDKRAGREGYERQAAMRPYHEERQRIRNRQLERENRHLLGRRETEKAGR